MKLLHPYLEDAQDKIFGGPDDNYITLDTLPIFIEEMADGNLDFFFDYIENEYEKDQNVSGVYSEGPVLDTIKSVGTKVKNAVTAPSRFVKKIKALHSRIMELEKIKDKANNAGQNSRVQRIDQEINRLKREVAKLEGKDVKEATVAPKETGSNKTPPTPPNETPPNETATDNEAPKEKPAAVARFELFLKNQVTDRTSRKNLTKSINMLLDMARNKQKGSAYSRVLLKRIRDAYDRYLEANSRNKK